MADQNFRVKNGLEVGIGGSIVITTPSGLVGVGTTVPTEVLDVNGNIRVRSGLRDYYGNVGSGSSVLISTGIGVSWIPIATAALQGAQGSVGAQGATGAQGSQGATGAQGAQGNFTVYRQSTPPSSPNVGDYWVDEDNGITYFYYYDGNSSQWVEFGPTPQQVSLTGIGISIYDSSSYVGVASVIDFGSNLTVTSVSAGIVTVNATGGGGGGESYWASTAAGIHTLSNVGIGTTNPRFKLEVGEVGAAGTSLLVNGDARVTGILSVGQGTITLDGNTNTLTVPNLVVTSTSTGVSNLGVVVATTYNMLMP